VTTGGRGRRLAECEARLDLVAFLVQLSDDPPRDEHRCRERVAEHQAGEGDERADVELEDVEPEHNIVGRRQVERQQIAVVDAGPDAVGREPNRQAADLDALCPNAEVVEAREDGARRAPELE